MAKRKDTPVLVRLGSEELAKLDEACDKLGLTRSHLMRLAVTAAVQHYELYGTLTLPLRLETPKTQEAAPTKEATEVRTQVA